jgi:hypothetical protein
MARSAIVDAVSIATLSSCSASVLADVHAPMFAAAEWKRAGGTFTKRERRQRGLRRIRGELAGDRERHHPALGGVSAAILNDAAHPTSLNSLPAVSSNRR